MLASLTTAGLMLTAPPATPPQQAPMVRPVEAAQHSAGKEARYDRGSDAGSHGSAHVGDLVRAARNYAALLELTADPNVAALFSGFGGRGPRHFDMYG